MVNRVMLDGPGPKLSDAPNMGMPTPWDLDYRACPTSLGPTACAVSKTIYSGCYAGATVVGEGVVGMPLLVRSLYHDFFGTLQKIPTSVVHAVNEVGKNGIGKLCDGHYAEGSFNTVHGAATLLGLAVGVKGIGSLAMKGAPKIYGVYADSVNQLLSRRPTPFGVDPFDIAVRRNPEFGGVRVGGVPLYAEVGASVVQQLQRLGEVKDGIFPAPHNPANMIREIEVMQDIGTRRYHFYVGIDFSGVGPTFELSISRLYYRIIDAPMETAMGVDSVSMSRATPPAVTYAQLGLTARELAELPIHEALGVVHNLVPEMAPMLEKLARLTLSEVD